CARREGDYSNSFDYW
nr:immunoglobulin heavy chain junction region [Mus musculus]MBK4188855.1 immunoglobulin heavy chain junction region [Mus musculus]